MQPSALELALALHQTPSLALAVRQGPLPADVFSLIRIAANDRKLLMAASVRTGASPPRVLEAARLYLEHALFHSQASHYRVLGAAPGDSAQKLREHQRWLMRWLHPDRGDDWDSVYATRVVSAYQQLRDPVRRREYDDRHRDSGPAPASVAAAQARPTAVMRPVWTPRELESGRPAFRRLMPLAGGVGALALLLVLAWPDPRGGGPEPGSEAPTAAASIDPDDRVPQSRGAGPVHMAPSIAQVAVARPVDTADAASPASSLDRDSGLPAAAVTVPGDAEVEQLMRRFRHAYADADIDALMGLFARDARHARGGRPEIRADYSRLFDASRHRALQMTALQWQRSDTRATGEGPFVAVITPARGEPVTVHGRMRMAVVGEAGEARIHELWHEESRP